MEQSQLIERLQEAEAQLEALRSGSADALIGANGVLFLVVDELKARLAAEEQRRAVYAHQQAIVEAERKRMAREVHDELGQRLTALRFELSLLRRELPDGSLQARIGTMLDLIESLFHGVRSIAGNLRPATLELGLAPAIEWLLQDFERRWKISCRLDIGGPRIAVGETTALAAIRILQESLTNVARHAAATRVDVRLEERERQLLLEIRDDGRGFDPAAVAPGHLGLLGMRERVDELNGKFSVDSAPEHGTRIHILLPIRQDD